MLLGAEALLDVVLELVAVVPCGVALVLVRVEAVVQALQVQHRARALRVTLRVALRVALRVGVMRVGVSRVCVVS